MVAHAFPRWDGDLAGAFIWRLAEALVHRDHAVTVLAPADRGEVGGRTVGAVRVRRLRYADPERETLAYAGTMHVAARRPAAALAFLGLLRALGSAVEEECARGAVDLVHAHWWVPGGVAAFCARRGPRPFVVTLHGTDVALARTVPGARFVFGALLRRAAAATAVSRALADAAASASGVALADIPVMPMPLVLRPGAARASERRQGIVFVGRLTGQKRVGVLLDALGILAARGTPMDLTIVGDGPERARLEERASRPDVGGRVRFVGAVPPDVVPGHLASARLLALPSVDEGLGLVVAEALVAGAPVVGARSGGIPDLLVDPDAGLLVPPDDAPALADAIARVGSDPKFLVGARRAGHVLAERLAPDAVAAGFERLYENVLSRAAGHG